MSSYFYNQNSKLLKSINRNNKSHLLKSLKYLKFLDPNFNDLSSYLKILQPLFKVKQSKALSTFELVWVFYIHSDITMNRILLQIILFLLSEKSIRLNYHFFDGNNSQISSR